MKRYIIFILVLLICVNSCLSVSAVTFYEYGDTIYSVPMNGSLSDSIYWYFYKGKECSQISNENAYEGRTALKCNIDSLNSSGLSDPLNFHTNKIGIRNGIEDNDVCFEVYTYGCEQISNSIMFRVYLTLENGNEKVFKNFVSEPTEKEGWVRNFCIVPAVELNRAKLFHMGLIYSPDYSATGDFFIDNINMKICPVRIEINDVISSGKTVNLDDIRVFGFDINGSKKEIKYNNFIRWSTESDVAEIKNNVLLFNELNYDNITVKADFFERSCDFSVVLKSDLLYSQPNVENDVVSISVTNNSISNQDINMFVLVFNENELYSVNRITETILSDSTGALTKGIRIPAIIQNPIIKVICTDSINGSLVFDCNKTNNEILAIN